MLEFGTKFRNLAFSFSLVEKRDLAIASHARSVTGPDSWIITFFVRRSRNDLFLFSIFIYFQILAPDLPKNAVDGDE
jgi:hypothetical protein